MDFYENREFQEKLSKLDPKLRRAFMLAALGSSNRVTSSRYLTGLTNLRRELNPEQPGTTNKVIAPQPPKPPPKSPSPEPGHCQAWGFEGLEYVNEAPDTPPPVSPAPQKSIQLPVRNQLSVKPSASIKPRLRVLEKVKETPHSDDSNQKGTKVQPTDRARGKSNAKECAAVVNKSGYDPKTEHPTSKKDEQAKINKSKLGKDTNSEKIDEGSTRAVSSTAVVISTGEKRKTEKNTKQQNKQKASPAESVSDPDVSSIKRSKQHQKRQEIKGEKMEIVEEEHKRPRYYEEPGGIKVQQLVPIEGALKEKDKGPNAGGNEDKDDELERLMEDIESVNASRNEVSETEVSETDEDDEMEELMNVISPVGDVPQAKKDDDSEEESTEEESTEENSEESDDTTGETSDSQDDEPIKVEKEPTAIEPESKDVVEDAIEPESKDGVEENQDNLNSTSVVVADVHVEPDDKPAVKEELVKTDEDTKEKESAEEKKREDQEANELPVNDEEKQLIGQIIDVIDDNPERGEDKKARQMRCVVKLITNKRQANNQTAKSPADRQTLVQEVVEVIHGDNENVSKKKMQKQIEKILSTIK